MNYIFQLCIILIITFIGEVIYKLLPLPIPASIYGLLLMLMCLKTGIVKLDKVKDTGNLFLEVMPLMFIPAAVGILTVWRDLVNILLPLIVITFLTTVIVMVSTGRMTQFIMHKNKRDER